MKALVAWLATKGAILKELLPWAITGGEVMAIVFLLVFRGQAALLAYFKSPVGIGSLAAFAIAFVVIMRRELAKENPPTTMGSRP